MEATQRPKLARWVALGLITGLAAGSVAVPEAAGAAATVDGKRPVTCQNNAFGHGTVKVNPPLTSRPAAGTRTWSLKYKMPCIGGTTNSQVRVRSAKITATFTSPASETCSALNATYFGGPSTWHIKWKAPGGKVNPTKIVFQNYVRYVNPNEDAFIGREVFGFPDGATSTSTVTGSYSGGAPLTGHHAAAYFGTSAKVSAVVATCNSSRGLKKFPLHVVGVLGIT